MWENLFTMASNTGIWAVLFVTLFFIQLKDSKKREEKYQQTIQSLADSLQITKDIEEKVKDIHEYLSEQAGFNDNPEDKNTSV